MDDHKNEVSKLNERQAEIELRKFCYARAQEMGLAGNIVPNVHAVKLNAEGIYDWIKATTIEKKVAEGDKETGK